MKTVKIVGIISSLRKNGNTAPLALAALQSARDMGADVTEIYLGDCHLEYCNGCQTCVKTGICALRDDFNRIRDALYGADGILLASPTYCGTCNAPMKNLFDRLGLYEVMTCMLGGKHVSAISTASSAKTAQKTAAALVRPIASGIFHASRISGIVGAGYKKKTTPAEIEKALMQARRLGENLIKDVLAEKRKGLQNAMMRIITRLFVRPMFIRYIISSKDDGTKAVYDSLLSRGLITEAR